MLDEEGGWVVNRVVSEAEVVQQYSARNWTGYLRKCCAERVATTVRIDIDVENYQWKAGPP